MYTLSKRLQRTILLLLTLLLTLASTGCTAPREKKPAHLTPLPRTDATSKLTPTRLNTSTTYSGPRKLVPKGVSPYAITAGLPAAQLVNVDTAYRIFIYTMDQLGYQPNAIIGAITYMMCEGGSYSDIMQGTFTYETDWIYPGPSGNKMDKTIDNYAWLEWLNGSGYERAKHDNGSCAIGLGLTQESDVWRYSKDNKTTQNATNLIKAAIAAGTYWQDPAFQVEYIINHKFSQPSAWDITDVPGVNPKTSSHVTSLEWAMRVACGVGMPAWRSDTLIEEHPEWFRSHTQWLRKATALYNKYSGVDEWFYKLEADWHNPFDGPTVEGAEPDGLITARMALLLSGDRKVIRLGSNSYNAEELVSEPTLNYYREACHIVGENVALAGEYFASADIAATTVLRLAGVDNTLPRMQVGAIREYMQASTKWQLVGSVGEIGEQTLKPGDVLISPSPSDPDGQRPNTGRHIMIWVGEQVAQERWPGTDVNVFEASYYNAGTDYSFYPRMRKAPYAGENFSSYFVFRCVKSDRSAVYWEKFLRESTIDFSELPRTYLVYEGEEVLQ